MVDIYLVKTNSLNLNCFVYGDALALAHYPKTRALVAETGSMRVIQGMSSRHLLRGDIFIPGRWWRYDIEISGNTTFFIIDFLDRWNAKQPVSAMVISRECYIPSTFFAAPAIAHLTRQSYAEDLPEHDKKAAILMLASLLRHSIEAVLAGEIAPPAAESRMVQIVQFIFSNVDKVGLRSENAAKKFNCSMRMIHKTCAQNGTTFGKLLMEIRLSLAARRLSLGEERISEIAYSCGFASLPHFSRVFKARFGVCPRLYRRNLQGQARS
ncbi:helix-turn-helix transcriptional regulator [Bradyrhizobium sp. USDA 3315]